MNLAIDHDKSLLLNEKISSQTSELSNDRGGGVLSCLFSSPRIHSLLLISCCVMSIMDFNFVYSSVES